MNEKNKFWGLIPGAGIGRRMGADIPKQYSKINGVPVFHHSLGKICICRDIYRVIAGISEDDLLWRMDPYQHPRFLGAFIGGQNRSDTVFNGLKDLLEYRQADTNDWVVVHDAARPCIGENDIDCLISEARSNGVGAVLGAKIVDTVKKTDDMGKVIETVNRNGFWRAFTPQVFRIGPLMDALDYAVKAGVQVTDECMAMEYAGHSPVMVQGDPTNIKITVPEDLKLAALFLSRT
jgi:2-C-methyl-D-erythritol 4-phosphate cytidylyltransferase